MTGFLRLPTSLDLEGDLASSFEPANSAEAGASVILSVFKFCLKKFQFHNTELETFF